MKNVEIGCRVKIGSSKAANFWKVIGMILPLPYTTNEAGGAEYLIARGRRSVCISIEKIKEVEGERKVRKKLNIRGFYFLYRRKKYVNVNK